MGTLTLDARVVAERAENPSAGIASSHENLVFVSLVARGGVGGLCAEAGPDVASRANKDACGTSRT
jgi:hypothetical protein